MGPLTVRSRLRASPLCPPPAALADTCPQPQRHFPAVPARSVQEGQLPREMPQRRAGLGCGSSGASPGQGVRDHLPCSLADSAGTQGNPALTPPPARGGCHLLAAVSCPSFRRAGRLREVTRVVTSQGREREFWGRRSPAIAGKNGNEGSRKI